MPANKEQIIRALKEGRARVERRWIQGLMNVPSRYKVNGWKDEGDISFPGYCIIGSVYHLSNYFSFQECLEELRNALPPSYHKNLVGYNDRKNRSKKAILGIFDKAIANLEQSE